MFKSANLSVKHNFSFYIKQDIDNTFLYKINIPVLDSKVLQSFLILISPKAWLQTLLLKTIYPNLKHFSQIQHF